MFDLLFPRNWSTIKKLIWLKAAALSSAVVKTVTAAIVHIKDALAGPAQNVTIAIEPVQDLNGYDHPWPAGGGKNLLDPSIFVDQAAWVKGTIQLSPNTAYICSSDMPSAGTLFYISPAEAFGSDKQVYSGHGVAFTTYETGIAYYQLRISDGTSSFSGYKTQLEVGSTATAYAPYSNICPIAGRAGTKVYNDPAHGGLIWWNQTVYDVDITGGTTTISDGIVSVHPTGSSNRLRAMSTAVIAGHKYFETVTIKSDGEHSVGFQNYLFPGTLKTVSASWTVLEDIQTASSTGSPYVQLYSVSNTDYQIKQGSFMFFDLTEMFGAGKEPATVQEFRALFPKESYAYNEGEPMTVSAVNGDPYTLIPISWEEEAGTVYGGTLDVTNGVLTVTHASVDMGSLSWSAAGTRFFSSGLAAEIKKPANNDTVADLLCSVYSAANYSQVYADTVDSAIAVVATPAGSAGQVSVRDHSSSGKTGAEFKTAMSGVQLVYELATPQTYQLSPQEVQLFAGENNIWADTGDTTLTYLADGRASDTEALNILLGGAYRNSGAADEATDKEAIEILLGGNR